MGRRKKVLKRKIPPTVTMQTHPDFFKRYERERKKMIETTGIPLSHRAFTEMMSKVNLDFSKIGSNIINGKKKPIKKQKR